MNCWLVELCDLVGVVVDGGGLLVKVVVDGGWHLTRVVVDGVGTWLDMLWTVPWLGLTVPCLVEQQQRG